MDELLNLSAGEIRLLVFPSDYYDHLLAATAALARKNRVLVLDCGGRYDPTVVVRAAGGRKEITDLILAQRAFNYLDVAKVIEQAPADGRQILILDLLSHFYDDSLSVNTRNYVAYSIVRHLERLGHGAGVAVAIQEPIDPTAIVPRRFYRSLKALASQTFVFEPQVVASRQMEFPWTG